MSAVGFVPIESNLPAGRIAGVLRQGQQLGPTGSAMPRTRAEPVAPNPQKSRLHRSPRRLPFSAFGRDNRRAGCLSGNAGPSQFEVARPMSAPNRNPRGLSAKLLAVWRSRTARMAKWGRRRPDRRLGTDPAAGKRSGSCASGACRCATGPRAASRWPGCWSEAYALVREAGRGRINMRHFDVQILGGIAMFHRSIVEMQTGEGKTLTATLPMYLHAAGRQGLPPGHGERLPGRSATPSGWGRSTRLWA